jgi:hypothetical protein
MEIMKTKTESEVRIACKEKFDDVRIKRNGEVHVKGRMPNSTSYGWYLLGFMGDAAFDDKLFHPDGSVRA